jgi:hypothetical protein
MMMLLTNSSAVALICLRPGHDVADAALSEPEDDMAKKARKRAGAKRARPAGKRHLVRRPKASASAKRSAQGRFKEMDGVGRSQKADKARKAKKTVRSGYGDQGDERPKTARRTRG